MRLPALLLLLLLIGSNSLYAQKADSTVYPYVLPIWGQKAMDRGFGDQLQLPFGLNVNYVDAYIELGITEFELLLGGQDVSGIINTETLNFTNVNATTRGLNLRADAWILPFLNTYILFSSVAGGTNVSLQPTWKNSEGEIILQLPEFSSEVKFDAIAYGAGSTLVFGWNGYFVSTDINYSRTATELLEDQVGYLTLSARFGYRFFLRKENKDLFIAPYLAFMYRNFVGSKGSSGYIGLDQVFPDLDDNFNQNVNSEIAANQEIIDDPATPASEKIRLQAQNQVLRTIQDTVNESGLFTAEINYFIKKELIQATTFQFGFNLQISKNWMVRGEYGVSDAQRFLMTGVHYRFGVRKKSLK